MEIEKTSVLAGVSCCWQLISVMLGRAMLLNIAALVS